MASVRQLPRILKCNDIAILSLRMAQVSPNNIQFNPTNGLGVDIV